MTSAQLTSSRAALHSAESNEWYTPLAICELARQLLGCIDLDPASCPEANNGVQAARYYTKADDGLAQPWRGRLWLNPPYGRRVGIWAARLVAEYEAGRVSTALLLVKNGTSNHWFAPLFRYPICFPLGRLGFSEQRNNTHGSAIVYLGTEPQRFIDIFGSIGPVVTDQRPARSVEVQPCLW